MTLVRTYNIGGFVEPAFGLTGLEAPGHSRGTVDGYVGREAAPENASGAVLQGHFRVGVYIDGR